MQCSGKDASYLSLTGKAKNFELDPYQYAPFYTQGFTESAFFLHLHGNCTFNHYFPQAINQHSSLIIVCMAVILCTHMLPITLVTIIGLCRHGPVEAGVLCWHGVRSTVTCKGDAEPALDCIRCGSNQDKRQESRRAQPLEADIPATLCCAVTREK